MLPLIFGLLFGFLDIENGGIHCLDRARLSLEDCVGPRDVEAASSQFQRNLPMRPVAEETIRVFGIHHLCFQFPFRLFIAMV